MREQQWLEVFKMGNANFYCINTNIEWQHCAGGRRASFNAHVILNIGEQDGGTKANSGVRSSHIRFVDADDAWPPCVK